mmetsp:Transcript_10422/g.14631  ORF Transcript_10422/g.14631 Transcript_10422/m.14631 type:complete len:256 (-) Transcript_10422:451-1218(-)
MEKWASHTYSKGDVQFLTVCVDSLGVAKQFANMFRFANVVNCHIPSRGYMPVGYGQLGCSGFIVVDPQGNFVSRKTRAYLDYGDAAFTHLEKLLQDRFGISPVKRKTVVPSTSFLPTSSSSSSSSSSTTVNKKEKQEEEKKDSTVDLQPVPSVGIDSMDAEHEQCEEALSLLLTSPNTQTLESVLIELTSHFSHEEDLMKKHGFGQPVDSTDPFSPFRSHVKDHERILELGYTELARASTKAQAMACSSKGGGGS